VRSWRLVHSSSEVKQREFGTVDCGKMVDGSEISDCIGSWITGTLRARVGENERMIMRAVKTEDFCFISLAYCVIEVT
jgi:hypothetical protein